MKTSSEENVAPEIRIASGGISPATCKSFWRRDFTLIELLAVMLLPALNKALILRLAGKKSLRQKGLRDRLDKTYE